MLRPATFLLALTAAPALAHPHVFIDTTVEVILNDRNEAVALRIGWTYDELYSLLFFGDLGLDPDGDGLLTPDEEARLNGFDMKWIEGFEGNTYVLAGEEPVAISGPRDWTASYGEGKLSSTHVRDLLTPVKVADVPLVIQAYDPGYYYAHLIDPPAVVTGGTGCTAQVFEPDLDAADAALQAALQEFAPDMDVEAEFPAVGAKFADEVRVTCSAS
ncbi:MAG: DUF1007 family protein [Tabrizicola sp.]|jgi:ABC-type uncharacterized transport system substrate-binding protein|nr:DUF1007 family protein [Tabrizicola sp.]